MNKNSGNKYIADKKQAKITFFLYILTLVGLICGSCVKFMCKLQMEQFLYYLNCQMENLLKK